MLQPLDLSFKAIALFVLCPGWFGTRMVDGLCNALDFVAPLPDVRPFRCLEDTVQELPPVAARFLLDSQIKGPTLCHQDPLPRGEQRARWCRFLGVSVLRCRFGATQSLPPPGIGAALANLLNRQRSVVLQVRPLWRLDLSGAVALSANVCRDRLTDSRARIDVT